MTTKTSRLQQSLFRLFVCFFPTLLSSEYNFLQTASTPSGLSRARRVYLYVRVNEFPSRLVRSLESCQMYQVLTRQTEKVLFAIYASTMPPDSSYVAITLIGFLFTHENGVQIGFCATLRRSVNRCFCYTG